MRLFSVAEATHFCQNFTPEPGDAEGGIKEFFQVHLGGVTTTLDEGTRKFTEYRSCLLREVERNLFLSASQYRRCLDLMIPSSSHWAFVTAYYASWYAAQAVLGMFGARVFSRHVVDVSVGTPGNQRLAKRRKGSGLNHEPIYTDGSHRNFWEIYYRSVRSLSPLVPAHLSIAVTPISADTSWLIDKRNEVNYQTFLACDLISDFETNFDNLRFPGSLPGILNSQYIVMEAMVELAYHFSNQFRLNTDSLSFLGISPLKTNVKSHVYRPKAPSLITKTRKNNIF